MAPEIGPKSFGTFEKQATGLYFCSTTFNVLNGIFQHGMTHCSTCVEQQLQHLLINKFTGFSSDAMKSRNFTKNVWDHWRF